MTDLAVNYWAIFASAVASIILGSLWYGPLFGKPWSQMMGYKFETPEAKKEMQKKAMPGYIGSFIGALIMACVLSRVITFSAAYMQADYLQTGLTTGFWMWLGFIVPVTVGVVFWDQKPWKLWYINAGYWLVLLLVMGAILGSWR